jgi:hypothetical protein
VKRYVVEPGTPDAIAAIATATLTASSIVAYAELRSAFARALRDSRVDAAGHTALVRRLDEDWAHLLVLAADDVCVREAGRLVDRHAPHALRGFDALHLASGLRLAGGSPSAVGFACWDRRLWRAARDEGFIMMPRAEPA